MAQEHLLDLTSLEPPAPLQKALSALETLPHGDYLRLILSRDPVFLYPLLMVQGFEYRTYARLQEVYEVLIWHRGDNVDINMPET